MENCWEYMNCPEATRESCPAFTEDAGGFCWLVAGTLCDDCKTHGHFIDKICDCQKCPWYQEKIHSKPEIADVPEEKE